MGPAYWDFGLLFVVHTELVGAFEPRHDLADVVLIDQVGAMGTPEEIRIQILEKFFKSAAVGLAFHTHVSAGGDADDAIFDGGETNVFRIGEEEAAGGFDENLRGGRLLRFEHPDECFQLLYGATASFDLGAGLVEGLCDALFVEGFEDVVDSIYLEGFDRVLIEGGGEDNLWHRDLAVEEFFDDTEAVETGHLHVEEDEVGIVLADQIDGFEAVFALGDNVDVGMIEQVGEFVAG